MTTQGISSAAGIAQDATAIVHAAIETSIAGDEDRLAECVHAMLANPILAAVCMWTFVYTSQSLLDSMAEDRHTTPGEVWSTLAPHLAEAEVARAVAAVQPQAALVGGR